MAYYDIGEVFQKIEEDMIASMSRNLKRHLKTEKEEGLNYTMWQAEQLAALNEFKRNNSSLFGSYFSTINDQIEEVLKKAHASGKMEQEAEILEAIREGWSTAIKSPDMLQGAFFRINDRKLNALIGAVKKDMAKAETAMLRMANDEYRKIIFNAEAYYNTGVGTLPQCVDMATKDFLSKGITCIEYANGARVGIDAYSRMAIRTAQTRAYLLGESVKRDEWGVSTVIVNKRGVACPRCLKYVGKVFYDDVYGSAPIPDPPKYPRLSEAIAGGLYHPNCKDIHTTYFEGISTKPKPMTKEQIDEANRVYDLEQRQRYKERQIRKYKRLYEGSVDPENAVKYKEKLHHWQEVQKDFIQANSDVLKRRPELEKVFKLPDNLQFGHNVYDPSKDVDDIIDTGHTHIWEETITKQPKCEEPGEKILKCSVCGEEKTEIIPALGHDMKPHITVATCTKEGYILWVCDRRGCLHSYKTDVTPALGHNYGDWVVTRQPTTTEVGRKQRVCKRCGKVSYSTIPKLKTVPGTATPAADQDGIFKANTAKQTGMTPKYQTCLENHFSSGSDTAKKAFNKYVPDNSIRDARHTGTAHFSPSQQKINMDFAEDLKNARGAGTTYFHEHGHYVDFMAAGKSNMGYVSTNNPDFDKLLRKDFDDYVKKHMAAKGFTRDEAYRDIGMGQLYSDETHAVSDLFGGCSGNKARGMYGHSTDYWTRPGALAKEAFAHMFDAQFNPVKYKLMQQYFPGALAEFEKMLGGII